MSNRVFYSLQMWFNFLFSGNEYNRVFILQRCDYNRVADAETVLKRAVIELLKAFEGDCESFCEGGRESSTPSGLSPARRGFSFLAELIEIVFYFYSYWCYIFFLFVMVLYIFLFVIMLLRAKRSERQRASGASFTWLMGTSRKAVSRKRIILDIWCWEQKVFVLTQLVDIWSEPARPGPTVTLLRGL